MVTKIKAARARSEIRTKPKLTAYEKDQIDQIAAWKSQPPNPFGELLRKVTLPVANVLEKFVPETPIRIAIDQSFSLAFILTRQDSLRRRAGVADLTSMQRKPLQECDRLASQTGMFSQTFATVEGALTGAGGVLTTLIDIPLLFLLSLWTILKIGQCYGYPLDQRKDRHFVVGVLITALSGTLQTRRQRLDDLHQLEDLLIEETQEDIVAEEILSLIFQLEIFEEIPGIGAISGAAAQPLVDASGGPNGP